MQRITVINMKGGCGKTTIATNLASAYAGLGRNTTLIDYDPQGSSIYWLNKRTRDVSKINGIAAYPTNRAVTPKLAVTPAIKHRICDCRHTFRFKRP